MNWARLIILTVVVIMLVALSIGRLASRTEAILQPFPFNHQVHVEDQELDCQDCHQQVAAHARATLPATETCQDCHLDPITETELEEELLSYTSESVEIPWERIYSVPDHVYFSHRRHVTLGKVPCQSCHGRVAELEAPPRYPLVPVSMDNCMRCHEEQQVNNDCLTCHR